MAKETYYFSHDSNALTDTKILNMRADYGLEGYGLYWAIIEMMRNEEDYKLALNKNTYRAIKTLTNTTIDIEKFIKDCLDDYELFKQEDENFYSNSLLRRMQEKDKKSAIAREKAEKRWNSNATAKQQQCSSNANKEKESKEKENKEKESKDIIPASEEKSSSASAKANKHKYGKYKNVLLKDEELQKLKDEYENWDNLIKYLDEYIEMKGYKAKSHYLCIKKWVIDAVNKQQNIKVVKGGMNDFKELMKEAQNEQDGNNTSNNTTSW